MNTLIVDDEPIARRVMREGLETFSDVVIVGEAENGKDALLQIAKLGPDLVFLDLQMPMMSGFEVVRNLGLMQSAPVIVIVTAFDEYAIQAFEAGAIDYLLKPVTEMRLKRSVERARNLSGRPFETAKQLDRIAAAELPPPVVQSRKVVGRAGEDYVLLDMSEILAFQAERELVWIVTAKQRLLGNHPLRVIEKRLGPQFQRIHRNSIVNVDHIRKLGALTSQRCLVTLSNALQLVVSKRQAHNIRKILNW